MSIPQMSDPIQDRDSETEKREIRRLKWIFGTSYGVQGSLQLSNIPTLYFIKFVLELGDAGGQLFQSLMRIGWMIKPLWGFISDRFPLFGYRRKSWFMLMALMSLSFWLVNAALAFLGVRVPTIYLITFNIAFAGYAFVDVVGDALMVEHGQRLKRVGSFVTFQWTMLSLSGASTAIVGGWFQEQIQAGNLAYWMIFLLTGIPPMITAIVGFLKMDEERLPKQKPSAPSKPPLRLVLKPAISSIPGKVRTSPEKLRSLLKNNKTLCILILFLGMWVFSPSIGYIQKSYLIDVRGFTPATFSTTAMVSWITRLISLLLFTWVTRKFPSIKWHHYLYAMIVLGAVSFPLSFFYYLNPEHPWWRFITFSLPSTLNPLSDWNRYELFWLVTGNFLSFATSPAFIIPLIIAGEVVKVRYAGMSYAFLMAFTNSTNTLEDIVGAGLYDLFSRSEMAWFMNLFHLSFFDIAGVSDPRTLILQIFIYISLSFTLLTIPFVLLLKRDLAQQKIEVQLSKGT